MNDTINMTSDLTTLGNKVFEPNGFIKYSYFEEDARNSNLPRTTEETPIDFSDCVI